MKNKCSKKLIHDVVTFLNTLSELNSDIGISLSYSISSSSKIHIFIHYFDENNNNECKYFMVDKDTFNSIKNSIMVWVDNHNNKNNGK